MNYQHRRADADGATKAFECNGGRVGAAGGIGVAQDAHASAQCSRTELEAPSGVEICQSLFAGIDERRSEYVNNLS